MSVSRVHRTQPNFERKGKPYRDASLILIASEGEKTEFLYFSFPFLIHRRVKIVPIPSENGRSAPMHVLTNLKEKAKQYDLGKGDRLWLAIDRDKWEPHQIYNVMGKRIQKQKIHIAVSNPCFELWLYLHFAPLPFSPIRCSKTMETKLRKVKGSYKKNSIKAEEYEQGLSAAMMEAEKSTIDSDGIPMNPGTQVHLIIRDIQKLQTIEDSELPCP